MESGTRTSNPVMKYLRIMNKNNQLAVGVLGVAAGDAADELSLLLDVAPLVVDAGAAVDAVDAAPDSLAAGALWPPRKSVTYQPLPFN
jgi:hypothetical protein